jgi:hypothetical protein
MNTKTFGAVCIGMTASLAHASAEPSVDALLCKRATTVSEMDANAQSKPTPKVLLDIKGDQPRAAANADGSRKLGNSTGKKGFVVIDAKTKKSQAVHNRDHAYDCDMAVDEQGAANSVRWLGNDVVFAQGWFCEEFDAKPYLANAKTGAFIGALKLKVSPEAEYNVAHLDGALWAISVYDHNQSTNNVVVVDTKSGKIKTTKEATADAIAKLPACPGKP